MEFYPQVVASLCLVPVSSWQSPCIPPLYVTHCPFTSPQLRNSNTRKTKQNKAIELTYLKEKKILQQAGKSSMLYN